MEITTVGRTHDCRYNKKHRLEKGGRPGNLWVTGRLTIKDDGDEHHNCLACAKIFLDQGVQRLQAPLAEVNRLAGT
jgi:hypothetical protein